MNSENIETIMKTIFEENGLMIFPGEEDMPLDLDSLRLISIIVAVENAFEIEIPDEYLSQSLLGSFTDFIELLNIIVLEG